MSTLPRQLCDLRLPPPLSEPQSPAPLWPGAERPAGMVGAGDGAGAERWYLMSIEFPFGLMRKFWNWIWGLVAHVFGLHTAELYP